MRKLKFRVYALDIEKMYELDRLYLPCTTRPNVASIYMQYTGVKDKNGKEIYEGDILKDKNGLGEVEWVQEHAAFLIHARYPALYHFLESTDEQLTETEVIGNVYEMPDWWL